MDIPPYENHNFIYEVCDLFVLMSDDTISIQVNGDYIFLYVMLITSALVKICNLHMDITLFFIGILIHEFHAHYMSK